MTKMMTGGAAIVDAILQHGVDTVFALPGVQTYPLMDALKKAEPAINVIGPRHEQTAAYMAMGYARATGKPGVFSVVPGPGVSTQGPPCARLSPSMRLSCCSPGKCPLLFWDAGADICTKSPISAQCLRRSSNGPSAFPMRPQHPALLRKPSKE